MKYLEIETGCVWTVHKKTRTHIHLWDGKGVYVVTKKEFANEFKAV